MDSSTRILVGIVAAVIVLVVLAIALPRLIQEEEAKYPPNTPEGTVQRFLRAAIDEDADTAIALLTEENTSACMESGIRGRLGYGYYDDMRVRLGDVVELDADSVTVTIDTTRVRDPELFELPGQPSATRYEFTLRRSPDGFWLIADSEWPIHLGHIRRIECDPTPTPLSPAG